MIGYFQNSEANNCGYVNASEPSSDGTRFDVLTPGESLYYS